MKILFLWFGFITIFVLSTGCNTSETGPTTDQLQLFITAADTVLSVPPDQTIQTVITVTLQTSVGHAVPERLILFQVDPPTLGFLNSDTARTNSNGQIWLIFTTSMNSYGVCEILAQLDDGLITASTSINIRERTPDPNQVASIELRVTHSKITGFRGEQRSETITAIARNFYGVAFPGAIIQFSIRDPEAWKGTIALAEGDSVTNFNGEISAIYSVILEQSGDVEIEARSGSVSSTLTIHLEVIYDMGQFRIDAVFEREATSAAERPAPQRLVCGETDHLTRPLAESRR